MLLFLRKKKLIILKFYVNFAFQIFECMKRLCLLLALALSTSALAQSSTRSSLSKIQEVYGSYWNELIKVDSNRQKVLTDLLENRVVIMVEPYFEGEKYEKLSTVPLFNKYNSDLKRDTSFDVDSFNILKYNISFFSHRDKVYRIDGTNYIVYIKSIKTNN